MDSKILGAEELRTALLDLPEKISKKYVRLALREGAKVIRLQCLADAPVRTGLTRSALKVRSGRKKKNQVSMTVGLGAGDFKGDTFYAGMVNYGWHIGKRLKGSARRFKAGTRWLNNAFDKSKGLAMQVIMYVLQKGIETEAAAARTVH